jgi:hypothetical protein
LVYNYLFSLGVTDPEEGLEEVRVGEGERDEGEEGAEAALQDRRPDVLNGLVRLLVSGAWTQINIISNIHKEYSVFSSFFSNYITGLLYAREVRQQFSTVRNVQHRLIGNLSNSSGQESAKNSGGESGN